MYININYFKCCILYKNSNSIGTGKRLGDSFGSVNVNKDVDCLGANANLPNHSTHSIITCVPFIHQGNAKSCKSLGHYFCCFFFVFLVFAFLFVCLFVFTQAGRPGFKFRLYFFFLRSVKNCHPGSTAHASSLVRLHPRPLCVW